MGLVGRTELKCTCHGPSCLDCPIDCCDPGCALVLQAASPSFTLDRLLEIFAPFDLKFSVTGGAPNATFGAQSLLY